MRHPTLTLGPRPALTAAPTQVTWIGTATVLIELDGFRILTDPNFLHQGQHAKLGGGLRSRRLTDPAAELPDLLPIDLVVLSHHHGDHFDEVAAAQLPPQTPIVTTRHAARKLGRQGFEHRIALEPWDELDVERDGRRLSITALPAKHAPQPLQAALPPVNGSLLTFHRSGEPYRIYVSGDTLLFDDLADIPERFPDIDLGLFHLGGTRILGVLLTMDGEQGARAIELIDPDDAIPIHHGDYTVFRSPLSDLDRALGDRPVRSRVHRLERGGSFPIPPR